MLQRWHLGQHLGNDEEADDDIPAEDEEEDDDHDHDSDSGCDDDDEVEIEAAAGSRRHIQAMMCNKPMTAAETYGNLYHHGFKTE